MRPLREAQRDVLAAMPRLDRHRVSLDEALGAVLGETIEAPHNLPPFDNSAVDGYAVIAADVTSVPVHLEVLEDVPAGSVPTKTVRTGTAVKIMTGAPIPRGADAIVMVEDTIQTGSTVEITAAASVGDGVRPAGGDLRAGDLVAEEGIRLGPPHLALLASVGAHQPLVARRPTVAIASTGDELLPASTAVLRPGAIRDSNRPLLRALLADLGCEVVDLGIVPDDLDALERAFLEGADRADAIITTGGVSMGEYDHVKQVLTERGSVEFWKVAMQPAKPFAFGHVEETPFFGLPGNPVSVMVAWEQFARPALLTAMGARAVFRTRTHGVLDEDVATNPEKEVFVRVAVDYSGDEPRVSRSGGQTSNVISALAAADAFAVIPVGVGLAPGGTRVTLELFRSPETRSAKEVLDG